MLQETVTRLEASGTGAFAAASGEVLGAALDSALTTVATEWVQTLPTPPPVIWRRKLQEIRELGLAALMIDEPPLPGQSSWAEIPFGGGPRAEALTADDRAQLPWDPLVSVVIPGTEMEIAGIIDRLDLAGNGEWARVTDYKSGKPPGPKEEPVLQGGAELQRCLYAFAVRSLLPDIGSVDTRLLYPKAPGDGLYPLTDPDALLPVLAGFIAAAARLAAAGAVLPGAGATDSFNDLAFALPGGAKETYFDLKAPLIAARLADLAPLWELE